MKKLTFIWLLCCLVLSLGTTVPKTQAQTTENVEQVLGISFGQPAAAVRTQFEALQPAAITIQSSQPRGGDHITWKNVSFADYAGCAVSYEFVHDQFCMAIIQVPVVTDPMSQYRQMQKDLQAKYGSFDDEKEEYKWPYSKDDGFFDQALDNEKTNIRTWWKLQDTDIQLAIANSKTLIVSYMDRERTKEYFRVLSKKRQSEL